MGEDDDEGDVYEGRDTSLAFEMKRNRDDAISRVKNFLTSFSPTKLRQLMKQSLVKSHV